MAEINDLLGFEFSKYDFINSQTIIIPRNLVDIRDKCIEKLNAISRSISNPLIEIQPTNGIQQIYLLFTNAKTEEERKGKFKYRKELRLLSFALNYHEQNKPTLFDSELLPTCLRLLNLNWRDDFIYGLLDCYLSTWDTRNAASQRTLSSFLIEKLKNYDGSRRILNNLRDKIHFFQHSNGDLNYGASLALREISLSDATITLSLPEQWISYPYFTGVFKAYVEKSKKRLENILDNIVIALDKHSNSTKGTKANKQIMSKIVCYSENLPTHSQDKVREYAFRMIGDPGIASLWLPFDGASPAEVDTLEKARSLLNEWLTRQFISVFFELCINDRRRKAFWMKYSKKITAFKVFGPNSVRHALIQDRRLVKYLNTRFATVEGNENVSAFMFHMGEYKFIEFSDPGYAFYTYLQSNPKAPSIELNKITTVGQFRNKNHPFIVYRTGMDIHTYNTEGRMPHTDGHLTWEQVLDLWILKIVRIHV